MSKSWQSALHILDAIAKVRRIQARGDIVEDDVLYDAVLRNLQTLSEATQHLTEAKRRLCPEIPCQILRVCSVDTQPFFVLYRFSASSQISPTVLSLTPLSSPS